MKEIIKKELKTMTNKQSMEERFEQLNLIRPLGEIDKNDAEEIKAFINQELTLLLTDIVGKVKDTDMKSKTQMNLLEDIIQVGKEWGIELDQ